MKARDTDRNRGEEHGRGIGDRDEVEGRTNKRETRQLDRDVGDRGEGGRKSTGHREDGKSSTKEPSCTGTMRAGRADTGSATSCVSFS